MRRFITEEEKTKYPGLRYSEYKQVWFESYVYNSDQDEISYFGVSNGERYITSYEEWYDVFIICQLTHLQDALDEYYETDTVYKLSRDFESQLMTKQETKIYFGRR